MPKHYIEQARKGLYAIISMETGAPLIDGMKKYYLDSRSSVTGSGSFQENVKIPGIQMEYGEAILPSEIQSS